MSFFFCSSSVLVSLSSSWLWSSSCHAGLLKICTALCCVLWALFFFVVCGTPFFVADLLYSFFYELVLCGRRPLWSRCPRRGGGLVVLVVAVVLVSRHAGLLKIRAALRCVSRCLLCSVFRVRVF